jgi:hypothetical protein
MFLGDSDKGMQESGEAVCGMPLFILCDDSFLQNYGLIGLL